MSEQEIIKKLSENGGKLWEKNGMRRIYFDGRTIAERGGMDVSYYNTGNVSAASIKDTRISNSAARSILWEMDSFKLWFDLGDNQIHTKGELRNGYSREFVEEFKAFVISQID